MEASTLMLKENRGCRDGAGVKIADLNKNNFGINLHSLYA